VTHSVSGPEPNRVSGETLEWVYQACTFQIPVTAFKFVEKSLIHLKRDFNQFFDGSENVEIVIKS